MGERMILNPAWQAGSTAWAQKHEIEMKSQKLK